MDQGLGRFTGISEARPHIRVVDVGDWRTSGEVGLDREKLLKVMYSPN
jgi:hypothetical protein